MKDTYLTVMDYNSNEVITYIITYEVEDYEAWLSVHTSHQLDEIHWMVNDCMPEIKAYLQH